MSIKHHYERFKTVPCRNPCISITYDRCVCRRIARLLRNAKKQVPPLESAYKDLLEYLFRFFIQCNAADLWPFRVYGI